MRAIIPCCGFGTRMSMTPNESKEMLEDTRFGYKHIIDYAIQQCKLFNLDPLIITRPAKTDLIQYCEDNQIECMIYEPKGKQEWDETVLASKDHWYEDNILILPDTRFNSIYCIEDIRRGLELGNNAVMALHEVTDPSKWGIVDDYYLIDKPMYKEGKWNAWGLIGFRYYYGQELFSGVRSGIGLENVGFTYLKSFEDITRGDNK